MKKYSFFLLYIISIFSCFSQDIKASDLNFKLNENKKVIWEKNYKFDANKDSLTIILQSFLKNTYFTCELQKTRDGFSGTSKKVLLSSTKKMAIGAVNPYKATITIKVMDYNYLVTVTDIVFDGLIFNYPIIGKKSQGPPVLYLEDFVVKNKKHEFRKNKGALSQLSVLNKDFDSYFTMNYTN